MMLGGHATSIKGTSMKAQFPLVLFAAAVVVLAADESSLSGEWQIHRSAAGNESKQTCTFAQKNNDLSGTCSSDQGQVKISGKVDGKNVTFTYKTEREGSPLTVIYRGTVDSATKIRGSVSAVEFGIDGEFTATRSK
jgi:preprotein translocase subunit SecD